MKAHKNETKRLRAIVQSRGATAVQPPANKPSSEHIAKERKAYWERQGVRCAAFPRGQMRAQRRAP